MAKIFNFIKCQKECERSMTNIESEEFSNLPFSLDEIQFSRAPFGIFKSLPVFAVSRLISSNRNFLLPLVLIYDGC